VSCENCGSRDDVLLAEDEDGDVVALCRFCRGADDTGADFTEFDYGTVSARDVAEDDGFPP